MTRIESLGLMAFHALVRTQSRSYQTREAIEELAEVERALKEEIVGRRTKGEVAGEVVDMIVRDFLRIDGLNDAWMYIDPAVREEIKERWIAKLVAIV